MIGTTWQQTGPERWYVLPYDVGPSTRHFALSDALVRTVVAPTLWWHSTNVPTLILGPTQARDRETYVRSADTSVARVRRHAGGAAIFATDSVLGLDVALPIHHGLVSGDVVESYRWLGQVWVSALAHLSVSARLVSIEEAHKASHDDEAVRALLDIACFGSLSPYEVARDGRKLVGLAQVRRRNGELLQAGIHLDFDAEGLAALLAPGSRRQLADALRSHAVGLREITAVPVSFADIMTAFQKALKQTLNVQLVDSEWPEATWKHATNT